MIFVIGKKNNERHRMLRRLADKTLSATLEINTHERRVEKNVSGYKQLPFCPDFLQPRILQGFA